MKKKYALTALSAVLTALPFTFPSLFILTLVSPTLFFYYLYQTDTFKSTLKLSFLWVSLYYLGVHYYFVSLYPLDFAGLSNGASIAVVLIGWVGISLFQGVELALFLCIFKKLSKRMTALTPLLSASLFVLCEWFQSLGWVGFPWGQISLTQYKFLPYIQSLSLLGPYFLSFITVLTSSLLAYFFLVKKKWSVIAAVSVFCLNVCYGIIVMSLPTNTSGKLDVAVVQPSILTEDKWSALKGKSLFDINMGLSKEVKEADLIVWSETAVPTDILSHERYVEEMDEFVSENDNALIVGAYYDDAEGDSYNAAIYVDRESLSLYFKQHLVPFGEYVPWRDFFEACLPFLTDINMLSRDLASGEESTPLDTRYGKIGALVCFDSIFTDLARRSVKNGAELITVITNDSWYKDSPALYHHNAQSVFRAVENRRWTVRCANTGVSSFIDEHGRIAYVSEPYETVAHSESVELIKSTTLYTQVGNLFVIVLFIFVLAVPTIELIKRKKAPRS